MSFHENHFSSESLAHFGITFVAPSATSQLTDDKSIVNDWDEEEEDDLGYYDDGVKRTLTDEQIEIFRHSELREMQKAQDKAAEMKKRKLDNGDFSDGEMRSSPEPPVIGASKKRKGKRKSKQQPKREPKPDLRKRTWDVVEVGLDSLDYD